MTLKGNYTRSDHFVIADTIGVPHPYTITPRHVAYASDRCGGRLDEEAIKAAEDVGVRCGWRHCQLKFEEHEQAVIVNCYAPIQKEDGRATPELHQMMLANKDEVEKNGYVGFTFVDKRGKDETQLDSDPG